jgi:hypothetical protein
MVGKLVGSLVGTFVGLVAMPYVNAKAGIEQAPGIGLDDGINALGIGLCAFGGMFVGHKVAGAIFKK